MSGLGRCAIAPGLLTALLVVACTGTGAAAHAPDSPESRLRARIADLHADVELLQVECAAARQNLMESLKQSGKRELGDRKMALSKIKEEEQTKLMKALDRLAEIEFQGRLDSARAESDRRKADFLKKIRSLHQKKLELAEAESEYKSSR